jgi:hypothetical protein
LLSILPRSSLVVLSVASAAAAGNGYAKAAACLAEAGTTEAIFSARKATHAQGYTYKQCMTVKGHEVVIRKSNGSRLY